jgi:N-glycosylase/DNA lyase
MKIRLDDCSPFDLNSTLCCGQTFRWDKYRDWWYGVVDQKILKIRQTSDGLEFENADVDFVKRYFRLHDDLAKIGLQIGRDKHIEQATEEFRGLRILRQDPWECLISYICATYKNIASIKGMLLNLSRKFGDKMTFDGKELYTFPTPKKLAKAPVAELIRCSLGYRAKYVLETARMVQENNLELEHFKGISYDAAKTELLNFPGVGLKVADCILLFSLEKLEAFPVDVWIKRAILRHYPEYFPTEFITKISNDKSLTNREYERLNIFGREYFGEYAGYAQEYLYHYERTHR